MAHERRVSSYAALQLDKDGNRRQNGPQSPSTCSRPYAHCKRSCNTCPRLWYPTADARCHGIYVSLMQFTCPRACRPSAEQLYNARSLPLTPRTTLQKPPGDMLSRQPATQGGRVRIWRTWGFRVSFLPVSDYIFDVSSGSSGHATHLHQRHSTLEIRSAFRQSRLPALSHVPTSPIRKFVSRLPHARNVFITQLGHVDRPLSPVRHTHLVNSSPHTLCPSPMPYAFPLTPCLP